MLDIKTHTRINQGLCGRPVHIDKGESVVELVCDPTMAVDNSGLVHGGFIFGLADHAAMIAVNHPYVVLYKADVTFSKPAKTGDRLIAKAFVTQEKGKRREVDVVVEREKQTIFSGKFICIIPDRHVLHLPPEIITT